MDYLTPAYLTTEAYPMRVLASAAGDLIVAGVLQNPRHPEPWASKLRALAAQLSAMGDFGSRGAATCHLLRPQRTWRTILEGRGIRGRVIVSVGQCPFDDLERLQDLFDVLRAWGWAATPQPSAVRDWFTNARPGSVEVRASGTIQWWNACRACDCLMLTPYPPIPMEADYVCRCTCHRALEPWPNAYLPTPIVLV